MLWFAAQLSVQQIVSGPMFKVTLGLAQWCLTPTCSWALTRTNCAPLLPSPAENKRRTWPAAIAIVPSGPALAEYTEASSGMRPDQGQHKVRGTMDKEWRNIASLLGMGENLRL